MPASAIKHRAAKSWHKIIVRVDPRMTDAVAAYLADLSGTGLEISAAGNSQKKNARTFAAETITAYIPIAFKGSDKGAALKKIEDLRQFLATVQQFFPDCPAPVFHFETIMEEDWGKKWKSFFTSFKITPTLTIRPSWEAAAELEGGGAVIEMDPGLAFGTGHHASTQLALLLLERLFQDKEKQLQKVLDLGTGSGILAMACGLFGAKEILALDNDPDAVETAAQNILRNRLEGKITVRDQEVSSVAPGFDLVVANITHDILAELAGLLSGLVNPQGFLVLSGILQGEQEHSIVEIYAKHGLFCTKHLVRDEWVALQLQKK